MKLNKNASELWLKDLRGGYTRIYELIGQPMGVDQLLTFIRSGEDQEQEIINNLGYEARSLGDFYEDLATEAEDFIRVIEEEDGLLTLEDGTQIADSTWNGERWHDNGKEYAPVYDGTQNFATLEGVIEYIC